MTAPTEAEIRKLVREIVTEALDERNIEAATPENDGRQSRAKAAGIRPPRPASQGNVIDLFGWLEASVTRQRGAHVSRS